MQKSKKWKVQYQKILESLLALTKEEDFLFNTKERSWNHRIPNCSEIVILVELQQALVLNKRKLRN